jgi:hypothetical protein
MIMKYGWRFRTGLSRQSVPVAVLAGSAGSAGRVGSLRDAGVSGGAVRSGGAGIAARETR